MIAKRAFDLAFALVALFLLVPLFIAVAIWIKLDSAGPVFFRQTRVGRGGKLFQIWKFRTMVPKAESRGLQLTVGDDARVTRSGRFLRKYKIDEMPQLLNVLAGDMSMVGPRPEVPRYVALYPETTRDLVLSLRPGLTDLASIEYRDESAQLAAAQDPERAYVEAVMPAKLALCERYVRQRSFRGDLAIIGRTFVAAFAPRD